MKYIKPFSLQEHLNVQLESDSEEYLAIQDDYGIIPLTKIDPTVRTLATEAIEIFLAAIPLWTDVKIVFVKNIQRDFLGRFRSGTATGTPIILLSEKELLKAAKNYKLTLRVVVETTVYHELGHAICELEREVFGYQYLEYGLEEEWVEEFAYNFHDYQSIPADLETFIKEYQKTL
jgi:hypothetical protein